MYTDIFQTETNLIMAMDFDSSFRATTSDAVNYVGSSSITPIQTMRILPFNYCCIFVDTSGPGASPLICDVNKCATDQTVGGPACLLCDDGQSSQGRTCPSMHFNSLFPRHFVNITYFSA